MDALRRIFRRDDTIDLTRDALDLEETRRLGLRDKRSAYEAIAAIKVEQQRLRRLRKLLEKQSGRLTPAKIRQASRGGDMEISHEIRSTGARAMVETQLPEIETRQKAVDDLWVELELFVRA
ncbi:MAG: hypothetical protein ACTHQE_07975 [Thermomicrobiales bacterium]